MMTRRELEVLRRRKAAEARDPRRYMTSEDLFGSRHVGLSNSARGDRADNQGRRYNVILMALRQAKPEWSLDNVRAEALRQLKMEDPNYAGAVRKLFET
jgi:hypothetical protein